MTMRMWQNSWRWMIIVLRGFGQRGTMKIVIKYAREQVATMLGVCLAWRPVSNRRFRFGKHHPNWSRTSIQLSISCDQIDVKTWVNAPPGLYPSNSNEDQKQLPGWIIAVHHYRYEFNNTSWTVLKQICLQAFHQTTVWSKSLNPKTNFVAANTTVNCQAAQTSGFSLYQQRQLETTI